MAMGNGNGKRQKQDDLIQPTEHTSYITLPEMSEDEFMHFFLYLLPATDVSIPLRVTRRPSACSMQTLVKLEL